MADDALADSALNDDGLADLWDAWSSHWEAEFSRLDGLEEQWKKKGAERVVLDAKKELDYAQKAEAAAKAREVEDQLEQVRLLQERERLREDATKARKQAATDAFEDGDDMVRRMSENAANRRLANEARRKKEREAAREAQQKRFFEEPKKPPPAPRPRDENAPPPGSFGARGRPTANGGCAAPGRKSSPRPRSSSLPREGARPPPVRFGSFSEFDTYWARFEQKVNAGTQDLHFIDVPWPTSLTSIAGVIASESLEVRKRKLRAALVRWHPDKWSKVLDCIHESDRAKVVEKVKEVTRRIIEEKKRYGS